MEESYDTVRSMVNTDMFTKCTQDVSPSFRKASSRAHAPSSLKSQEDVICPVNLNAKRNKEHIEDVMI